MYAIAVVTLTLGAFMVSPVIRGALQPNWNYPLISKHGFRDSHASYHPFLGVARQLTHADLGDHPWKTKGLELRAQATPDQPIVAVEDNIGLVGFYAGPNVHIVDPAALGDPLLARLPQVGLWEISHYYRPLPAGYLESLPAGPNHIEDPTLHELYDQIILMTRAPVFSTGRFAAIRKARHLAETYRQANPTHHRRYLHATTSP